MMDRIEILCVEDNPGDIVLIKSFLEEEENIEFVVYHCEKLAEAISFLREEQIDIVLLDLGLPDSKGLASFTKLSSEYPETPILVLTGNTDVKTGLDAVKAGAQDYLIKSEINPEVLTRSIIYSIERKSIQKQLEEAKRTAEQADKLKSSFLANMSHDLRTPMNSIIGFSELLRTNPDKDESNQYIDLIVRNGEVLLNLLNDIIDVSKIEAGQLKIVKSPTDIQKLLDQIYQIFTEKLKSSGNDFKLELIKPEESAVVINTDEARLFQILTNLLDNSFKFTEEGKVEFGASISGNTIEFFVEDTGIGIPEDQLEHIFQRFGQVEETYTKNTKGTGLGLAISKHLVTELGGELKVISSVNIGTRFYFAFPYKEIERESVEDDKNEKLENNNTQKDWSNKRILVVEDMDSNLKMITTMLATKKINILTASTGEEAVELIKSVDKLDVVLMDLRLPKMDGFEATRKIKAIKPDLPVIVVTALVMGGEKQKAFDAGCDDYLSKPVRPKILLDKIAEYL